MAYTSVWNNATPLGSAAANSIDELFRSLKVDVSERLLSVFQAIDADPLVIKTGVTTAGTFGVGTNLTVGGTLGVTGVITATGGVNGNLTGAVTGNASTATTLQTTRTIWGQSFNGSANISGAITGATTGTFSSNVTVGGTLSVTSTGSFSGAISVAGLATLAGVSVTNNATVGGTLTVTGVSYFNNQTRISQTSQVVDLYFDAAATEIIQILMGNSFGSSLSTEYSSSELFLAHNAQQPTIGTTSWAHSTSTNASNAFKVGFDGFKFYSAAAGTVTGAGFWGSPIVTIGTTGNTSIGGTLNVIGASTLNSTLTVGSTLDVNSTATINIGGVDLNIGGTTQSNHSKHIYWTATSPHSYLVFDSHGAVGAWQGAYQFNLSYNAGAKYEVFNMLDAGGAATVHFKNISTFTITSTSVSLSGTLSVTGNSTFSNNLTVNGALTVGGSMIGAGIFYLTSGLTTYVQDSAGALNLGTGGAARITIASTGGVSLSSTLAVTGAATLSSNLTVDGVATLNGSVSLGNATTDTIGFYGIGGTTRLTVTGSRGGNAALEQLLTCLALTGIIADGTTA